MSDDELSYLQPGFDLTSLTVPRLRSILVSHDVPYPASAKKPQLIQILTDEVMPRARKIINARARTKRTSKGITDVPSSQESSTIAGDEDEAMPPPPVPKTPRGRKSKTGLVAKDGDDSIPPGTAKQPKTPGRRSASTKHPRASDTETDADKPQPSARKTRKSSPGPVPFEAAPSVKIAEPTTREALGKIESPFTDDNPFQSGSSPTSESRRVSSTSRSRKSIASTTDRRKSSQRGQTSLPPANQADGISAPSRSTFEFPVTRLKHESVERDNVPTTEEFTPEEEAELNRETALTSSSGHKVASRSKALVRRKKPPTSTVAKVGPLAILMIVLAVIGAWYRKEKMEIGYCGVGKSQWSLAENPQIPAWVHDNFQPVCVPCPQHAYCYPDMNVACETNYVLQPHPLSLGGLIPLRPTCEPDGEKVKRIKAVGDKVVEELRERRAAYECGEEIKQGSTPIAGRADTKTVLKGDEVKLEIAEEDLKKEVSKLRRKGMSVEEFEDLWQAALGDIVERDEIEVTKDGSGRILLSSSSLARLPFVCAIRRSFLQSLSRNRLPLSILIALLSAASYARSKIRARQEATAQIPGLVSTTLDRLGTQAALAADGRVGESFISIGQLRDDVLRGTFNAAERERVWTGVRAIVEGNSNVRVGNREGGRTGEWSRVWEWIGPVNLAPGLEGRRSGGSVEERRPSDGAAAEGERGHGMVAARKWDEGRPIY